VELLAGLLAPSVDGGLDGETRSAIRLAAQADSAGIPDTWLAFGRMQRNIGNLDSALTAFRRYIASGGDHALGSLEEARTLSLLQKPMPALQAYLDGAMYAGSPTGRSAYRRDLRWVGSPVEMLVFDSLPRDSIGTWIVHFWSKRDATSLRDPGSRLIEHLRRWTYVFAHFQLPPTARGLPRSARLLLADSADLPRQAVPDAAVNSQSSMQTQPGTDPTLPEINPADLYAMSRLDAVVEGIDFVDDRALIYMRFGEPDKTGMAVAKVGGIPATLSWLYAIGGDNLLFHFACEAYCVLTPFPRSLDGVVGLDTRYEALAGQLRMGHPSTILLDKLHSSIAHDLRVGLTTDGFPPHFKHQLEPAAQFFAVGAPGRVLVVFALPGDKLEHMTLPDGGAGYPVVLRVIATNAAGQIARMDTTRRFRSDQPLAEGQYLFGLEELKLAPGTWDVRLLVTEAGLEAGGAIGRIGVTIPSNARLALSDLVMGSEGSGLTWRSPAGADPLNQLDAFSPKGSAELYYELHGARPNSIYQTDIAVKGVYGDARGTVHLTFSEQAHGAVVRIRRSIGLDQLETGQYLVTVTVTEQGTGRTAVQRRYLNVRE
jgi:hypothetical protein